MTDTKHEPTQKASHTPGPWHVAEGLYGNKNHISVWGERNAEGCCEFITEISATPNPNTDRKANARLIAAAPDFKWLAERAHAIRTATGWTKAEIERSWADWDARYAAAIAEAKGLGA